MYFLMRDIAISPTKAVPNRIRRYKHKESSIQACKKLEGSYVLDDTRKLVAHNFKGLQ